MRIMFKMVLDIFKLEMSQIKENTKDHSSSSSAYSQNSYVATCVVT